MSIDSSYRLPVLIAYLGLVMLFSIWPADKNLAELISLSALLLVASQFWYLEKGGALVMLYLPLAIAMMFRPTLSIRRPLSPAHQRQAVRPVALSFSLIEILGFVCGCRSVSGFGETIRYEL